eukprot:s3651_g2.t1
MQHSRWTRQIRRLQHYSRCAGSPSSITVDEHKASLWRKIMQAPGFLGGFSTWWSQLPKAFLDTPTILPRYPPTERTAQAVFLEFSRVYRAFETSFVQSKAIHAAQRRINDPLQIYRDLQRERAEPVQTIVVDQQLEVQNIRPLPNEQVEVCLAEPIPQGLHSIPIQGIETHVDILDEHRLHVPTVAIEISIARVEADVQAILTEFEKEWAPRWQRHDNVDPEKWDVIIDFMKQAVPPRQVSFPAISMQAFRKAVASKKKYAAVGPDGVSKVDLLRLPDTALEDLLALIQRIEQGAPLLAIARHLGIPDEELRKQYMTFPDTTAYFSQPEVEPDLTYTDLFLDGSCMVPAEIDLRTASWACVQWTGFDFVCVASGLVPGWRQTSLRAEITAAISALKYCVDQPKPCRLWFDNEGVQKMIDNWIQGLEPEWRHKQDADLWGLLHSQFQHSRPFVVAALKVQAHALPLQQDSVLDAWAVTGNIAADVYAEEARQRLPPTFWSLWNKVKAHQTHTLRSGLALHKLFVQIGIRAQATSIVNKASIPQQLPPAADLSVDPGIMMLTTKQVTDFPKHLQVDETFHILQWSQSLVDTTQGISWVSYHQLLVDYQRSTGRLGPYTNGRKWTVRCATHTYSYPQQVQWFARFLQNLAKAGGEPLRTDQRRATSLVIPSPNNV